MEFVIQVERKGKGEFYVVLVKIKYREVWRFIRCFYTYDRAANFLCKVKAQLAKGDYTWLTLKN